MHAPQRAHRAKIRHLISMIQDHVIACGQEARGTYECFRALEREVLKLAGFSTFVDALRFGGSLIYVHPRLCKLLTHVQHRIIAHGRIHTV
eukprot:4835072-Pyramimonas_sp.AAC.1